MGDGGHEVTSRRPGRARAVRRPAAGFRRPAAGRQRSGPRFLSLGALVVVAALGSSALAACGGSGASTGPVTLNFYNFTDPSGAVQQAVNTCSAQSDGKYTISYNKLPLAADQQRQQLVRRLAAGDSSMDILGLDVTWEAEFAEAGWILPWTGTYKQQASNGHPERPAADRHLARQARTRCPTTATPSCCGTAPTWCRTRRRPGTR